MKDSRFGNLSKSAAIVLHHWEDFQNFLEKHPSILSNNLACMVRSALEFDYIKTVLCVIAAFGIQIVEPYFIVTKSSKATHSELQSTFTDIHTGLKFDEINESFFSFENANIRGIQDKVVKSVVLNEYGPYVANSIQEIADQRINAAVALSNKMRTKLGEVLLRQRGAYYEFGDGNDNSKDSVFKQTKDVDRTITQNIEMERLCGTTDNRLKKKPRLETP